MSVGGSMAKSLNEYRASRNRKVTATVRRKDGSELECGDRRFHCVLRVGMQVVLWVSVPDYATEQPVTCEILEIERDDDGIKHLVLEEKGLWLDAER